MEMIIYGKQLFHTKEQIETVSLCAYGMLERRKEGIYAGRIDESEGMLFTFSDTDRIFDILADLRDGVYQTEIISRLGECVGNDVAEEFIECLIQGGVLE